MSIFDKSFFGSYKQLILYFDYNLLIPFLKNNDTNFTVDNYSTNTDFTEQDLSIQDQENIYKSLISYCCTKENITFSNNFIYGIQPSFYEKIKNLNYENNIQKMTTEINGLSAYEHYSYYFYNILKTNKIAFDLNCIPIWFNEYSDFYKLYFSLVNLKYNNLNIAYFVSVSEDRNVKQDFIFNQESYDNILSNLDNTADQYVRIKTNNASYNPEIHDPKYTHIIKNSFHIVFKNISDSLYGKLKTTDSNEYLEMNDIIKQTLFKIKIYNDENVKNYSEISATKLKSIQTIYKDKQSFIESRKQKFAYWGSLFNAQKGFGARPYEYYHWILWLIRNNIIKYSSLTTLDLDTNNVDKLKLILDYANKESIIKTHIALD